MPWLKKRALTSASIKLPVFNLAQVQQWGFALGKTPGFELDLV